jgi:hypothetical protein
MKNKNKLSKNVLTQVYQLLGLKPKLTPDSTHPHGPPVHQGNAICPIFDSRPPFLPHFLILLYIYRISSNKRTSLINGPGPVIMGK